MSQQGQLIRLKSTGRDGEPMWAEELALFDTDFSTVLRRALAQTVG